MFEMQSVLQGPASAKKQLATMAALLHLSVASVLVVGLAWRIDAVDTPTFPSTYLPIAFLPAEWSAPLKRPAEAPAAAVAKASVAVQPEVVPDAPPTAASASLDADPIAPLTAETDIGGTSTSDSALSDIGGVGPGSGLPTDAATIVWKPGAGIVAPQVLYRVDPSYPEIARAAHRQGAVIVEAEIATDGSLQAARVVSAPLGFGLEQSALDAIRSWRFAPARFGDRPVAVYYRWNILFSLR
ncbi:MAG: energy transducer TonB [Thermoanaerobaculia bacterium]